MARDRFGFLERHEYFREMPPGYLVSSADGCSLCLSSTLCGAPSGVLNKDALAIVDVVDAVILAHLVAMDAVVPARIVERLCFYAIRASLRLWCLV
jgi:hypothetical protein